MNIEQKDHNVDSQVNENLTEQTTTEQVVDKLEEDKFNLEEFLAKEENRQDAAKLARQIDQLMKGKWFTLNNLKSKGYFAHNECEHKVTVLRLFGFIQTATMDNNVKYKVMLTKKDKLFVYGSMLEQIEKNIDRLQQEKTYVESMLKQVDSLEE